MANPLNILSENIKNILVVRKHNQIGDMLCSLTLYKALKKKFPQAKITLVLSPTNYEIDFKELNPYADEIIFYKKGRISNIIKFYKDLRKTKFQIGIVPSTIKVSNTSHIINFFSGAKIRVGVKSVNGKPNKASILLNVKSDFDWESRSQSERNLDVVRQIRCDLREDEINSIKFNVSQDDMDYADKFTAINFPDKNKFIIAFHTGAGESYRLWKTENFIKLIKKIYDKYNCYVLITSGAIDSDVIGKIKNAEELKGINPVFAENLPLKKLAAILQKTSLYITNNTGTLHLAHYSGVRTLALFTSSQVNDWAYKSETESYVSADYINDISVEQVFEECCRMIEKFRK
jgi:ADP-heptose:LPS heptosyltransferase